MARCLIALGSNLGARARTLQGAIEQLEGHSQVHVVARSRWHETAPVGGPPGQEPFLNGAALLETDLDPQSLHRLLKEIEERAGRRRDQVWGPRTLDLDLLLHGEQVLYGPDLILPHPRMTFRRFVLEPAVEVAAEMRHPVTGGTLGELLAHLNTTPRYLAIAGIASAELVGRLQEKLGDAFVRAFPPGPFPAAPISFWQERLPHVIEEALAASQENWVVGDFSWGEADRSLSREEADAVWRTVLEQAPQPRLLVLLLPRERWGEAVAPPGYQGPQLVVGVENLEEAASQTWAAMQASETSGRPIS